MIERWSEATDLRYLRSIPAIYIGWTYGWRAIRPLVVTIEEGMATEGEQPQSEQHNQEESEREEAAGLSAGTLGSELLALDGSHHEIDGGQNKGTNDVIDESLPREAVLVLMVVALIGARLARISVTSRGNDRSGHLGVFNSTDYHIHFKHMIHFFAHNALHRSCSLPNLHSVHVLSTG